MKKLLVIIVPSMLLAGCTIHPAGERQEREHASAAGRPYAVRPEQRPVLTLPPQPTPDDLVRFVWLTSPELEQRYWEWKSAIEQIPQDGTQATNLVLYAGAPVTSGSAAFNRTVITAANDPMADIQWPSKPGNAAQRALEEARAAGLRFEQAKLEIRQKVLEAWYDYALAVELVRLQEIDTQLLETAADVSAAGIASGGASQSSALGARIEAELAGDQVAQLRSHLPSLRAALNAILGRDPVAPLPEHPPLPPLRATTDGATDLLQRVAQNNPELAAIDADARGKQRGVTLAKLQYLPDFSLSASSDLGGVAQNLTAMITVPLMKYQAIDAAIAQAEANLRATEAMRRQTGLDLRSKVWGDVASVDDLRRQSRLLEGELVPRAQAVVTIDQAEYEGGRMAIADLLASERAVTALQRLAANVKVAHEERLLEIEAIVGRPLD